MLLFLIQLKDATEVLSKNDVTVIGVLLFVILMMATALGFLWRAYRDNEQYIKEQDRANLEMLKDVTAAVKDVATHTNDNRASLGDLRLQSQRMMDLIDTRLTNICRNGHN